MGCGFCPSFRSSKSSSNARPQSDPYSSPVPKSEVFEAQSNIQPVLQKSKTSSIEKHINEKCRDETESKRVHFDSKVNVFKEDDENGGKGLRSCVTDSKAVSSEGESYESLFSLELINGWRSANEEEVMSKEIADAGSDTLSLDDVHVAELDDEGFTFPTVNRLTEMEETNLALVTGDRKSDNEEEVSVDSSLSSWLVEPENTPISKPKTMSRNDVVVVVAQKTNGVSERRRVLGELSLAEVKNHNLRLQGNSILGTTSLKSSDTFASYLKPTCQATTRLSDCDSSGSSRENKPDMRRSFSVSKSKQIQKVDIQSVIPVGFSLARSAMHKCIV